MERRTPVPWKKTQEGRIVYDRPPKSFTFNDLQRILRQIKPDSPGVSTLTVEQFLRFLLDLLTLFVDDAIKSFLLRSLALLLRELIRVAIALGAARIVLALGKFGGILALIELIEASAPFKKTTEPLA